MRIAINTRFLLDGKMEGLGWYTHEVVRRLVLAHPEHEFFFFFDRPYHPRFLYAPNVVPVVLFPPARHALLWYAWFEFAIPRALKRVRADVFFSPDSFLSLSTRVPTLLTVHDIIPLHHPNQVSFWPRHFYLHFFPKYISKANHIIAISNHVAADISATCHESASAISVAYNGVRAEFRPLSEEEKRIIRAKYSSNKPYILFTGAINPRKNIQRLITAFDTFKTRSGSDALLLLAGKEMGYVSDVRNSFENSPFKSDIHFLGYVPEGVLEHLVASADLVANLSLEEGFGLPLVEALQCGTPLMVSDIPVFREVAGDAAFFVAPENVEAISVVIESLMRDSALRYSKQADGFRQAQKFSWDLAAQHVYDALFFAQKNQK